MVTEPVLNASSPPLTDATMLLRLLQLASPALPVGAFSYSEGLETLVQTQQLTTPEQLRHWLEQELTYGAIYLEAVVMLRSLQASATENWPQLLYWNHWLSASRETEELRLQSMQMGRSLLRLVNQMQPPLGVPETLLATLRQDGCHFAIAFGITATHWQITAEPALLGYLQTWATNLVTAAVKLIPLGQTLGQQLLWDLQPVLLTSLQHIQQVPDEDLEAWGWGLALASMTHETLYSRLFRS